MYRTGWAPGICLSPAFRAGGIDIDPLPPGPTQGTARNPAGKLVGKGVLAGFKVKYRPSERCEVK